MSTVLNGINDLVEIQRAKVTLADTKRWSGKIHYVVRLYGLKREYVFSVDEIERNRSQVRLEMSGEEFVKPDKTDLILRQFALLDSMLVINITRAFDEKVGDADGG